MTRSPENIMKQLSVEGKTGEHFHFCKSSSCLLHTSLACPLFPGDHKRLPLVSSACGFVPWRFSAWAKSLHQAEGFSFVFIYFLFEKDVKLSTLGRGDLRKQVQNRFTVSQGHQISRGLLHLIPSEVGVEHGCSHTPYKAIQLLGEISPGSKSKIWRCLCPQPQEQPP